MLVCFVHVRRYFGNRNPDSRASQVGWAGLAAATAGLAEIPFDHAKRALFGSRPVHIFANLLYVPFGGMMLIMYDTAACSHLSTANCLAVQ
eukprot:m.76344 g.76344  ORF g.76344 m.76344 type:complete len:91 (+) comp9053_c0_seq2:801-1073(+)